MKIAYLTNYDSNDIHKWSGLSYYIRHSLAKSGVEILPINCDVPLSLWYKIKSKIINNVSNRKSQFELYHTYLKLIAAKAEKELQGKSFDLIFSPGSLPLAYLNTDKPMAFWTDATFDNMVNFYPYWTNLTEHCFNEGNKAENLAISKASLIFYTSDWASESAIYKYGANRGKVKTISFGANLDTISSEEDIHDFISMRFQKKTIELLFIGVNWESKGGERALETVIKLREKGYEANLIVVGCNIPKRHKSKEFLKCYGFISKKSKKGAQLLHDVFKSASFFILPTSFDCVPVVFAEACSYGLPIISTNVGGCCSIVRNGYNGYCLDRDFFTDTAAARIIYLSNSKSIYEKFSLNAYNLYLQELNWDLAGKRVVTALNSMLYKVNCHV
jgi:glycosyltransferase involved in cell wall biosynthesis